MTVFRYILNELIGRFCFIFCCLTLVVLLGFSMQQMHKIGGGGVAIIRHILPFLIGYVSIYTVPVALLLTVAVVYLRMAREREIIALQAAGYSKQSLARPALVLAFFLSCGLFYINNYQLPNSEYERDNLEVRELETLLASSSRKQNALRLKNTVFRYETIKEGYLHNVQVIEFDDSGSPSLWFSGERGRFLALPSMDDPVLKFELENVTVSLWKSREKTGRQSQVMRFTKDEPFIYRRHMKELLGLEKKELEETTLTELIALARGKKTSRFVKDHPDHMITLELSRRAVSSIAPVAFVILCVPIAMLVGSGSRSGGIGMIVLPLLILFYAMHLFATQFGEASSAVSPLLLFWPPPLLFILTGFVLIRRGN